MTPIFQIMILLTSQVMKITINISIEEFRNQLSKQTPLLKSQMKVSRMLQPKPPLFPCISLLRLFHLKILADVADCLVVESFYIYFYLFLFIFILCYHLVNSFLPVVNRGVQKYRIRVIRFGIIYRNQIMNFAIRKTVFSDPDRSGIRF